MDKLYIDHYNQGRLTQEDIALATGLSILQVRQALYKAGCQLSNTHTEMWAQEVSMTPPEGTLEEQARQYLVDMFLYRRLKYQVKSTKQTPDRTELKTAVAKGEKTQAELAAEFGVSQATVSRHNPKRRSNKPYAPRMHPSKWKDVKKYLETHSISDAARHFGTTRTTIYRKLNDDN